MKKNILLSLGFILLGIIFIGNNAFACSGGQCLVGSYCVNSGQVYNGKICNNGVIENITVPPTTTTCPSPNCIHNNVCYNSGSTIYLNGSTYTCSGGNVTATTTNPSSQCSLPNCKYADGVCAQPGTKALYGGNCYSCSNGAINNVAVSNCSSIVSGGSSAQALCTYASAVTAWTACSGGISYAASGGITYATNPSLYNSNPACVDVPTSRACAVAPSGLTAVCSPTGTSSILSWSPIANASYAIKIDKQDVPTDLWKNDCNVSQYDGDICVKPQADYSGIQWGFGNVKTVSGDYDGDGKSDLAVWSPSSGKWYIRPVSGASIVWDYAHGGSTMIPVSGDYNGDGKSDLALWNPVDGKWYILDMVTKNQIVYGYAHGGSTMIPVSGDFDGDKKSDLAVWNPTDGKWYIRTVSGTIIAWGVQFGGPGMIPVSGDYNGDGKSDMALWNTNPNYNWYIKDAPDMQNNFSFFTTNNSLYKWWVQSVVNGVSSDFVSGPDFTCGSTCYTPQDKFRLTQVAGTYSQINGTNGLCKTEYGQDWEFATITDADEVELMTGNNGGKYFNQGFAIKNVASNSAPFSNNVCAVELANSSWPETDKMILFETGRDQPFCYSDVHKETDGPFFGLCRNTNLGVIPSCAPVTGPCTSNAKVLVVAGGGGGARNNYGDKRGAGGGGAGGLISSSTFPISAQSYNVIVGAGGAGGSTDNSAVNGFNGGDSIFSTLDAVGGGGGAGHTSTQVCNGGTCSWGQWLLVGGSGGGGSNGLNQFGQNAATGTPNQGHDGGPGEYLSPFNGGGGGGAGAAGGAADTSHSGAGGAGLDLSSIFGTNVGVNGWFAGGGGAVGGSSPYFSAGGQGGGGNGGATNNGTPNTGGGGGANKGAPGSGGSGIVIVRYNTADFGTSTGGTITTIGSETIHTFTSSGVLTLTCPNNFTASCYGSPNPADTSTIVTWKATATGGTEDYTYSWSGTDGLTGTYDQVPKIYTATGTKQASVLVTSGTATTSVACTGAAGGGENGIRVNPPSTGAGECDTTRDQCLHGSPVVVPDDLSDHSDHQWWCNGTSNILCHSSIPVDHNLDCSLLLTSPAGATSANVNTNTEWTVSSTHGLSFSQSQYIKTWVATGDNNSVSGTNTLWDKIFTTIGQKTVSVTVTNGLARGGECSATVNVVQTGGGTHEI